MSDRKYKKMIGVIDQGTSSSRFIVFSAVTGEVIAKHQIEIDRDHPESGWVQQSANDIYQSSLNCMNMVAKTLRSLNVPIKVSRRLSFLSSFLSRISVQSVLRIKEKQQLLGIAILENHSVQLSFGLILEHPILSKNISIAHRTETRTHFRKRLVLPYIATFLL